MEIKRRSMFYAGVSFYVLIVCDQHGEAWMDAGAIERYLALVGKELKAMNMQEPIQLLLIEDGYMLTRVQNRTVTGDVDTVWVYPEVYADSEIYRLFRGAVQFVADDESLEPTWLNIDASDFMRAAGPLPKGRYQPS